MNYEELYEMATEKAIEGDYEKALKYLDKAIKENENDARVWMAKGTALAELGKNEEAIRCYDKTIEIDANNDFAFALKGVALYEIGNGREAKKYFDIALKMNPKNFTAMYWKGVMEGKAGNKEEEANLKGKSAFIFFAAGPDIESMEIFEEVYYSNIDLPIRYECGIAYAAMLGLTVSLVEDSQAEKMGEEYHNILSDCWKNKEKVCKSAEILLNAMMNESFGIIIVNDEKDFTFKKLFELWFEELEEG